MKRVSAAFLAGLLCGVAQAADICEPLRERIEAQVAATGATDYVVVVLDIDTPSPGKVVGTCARGARKIVYAAGDEARQIRERVAASAPASVVTPTPIPAPTPAPAAPPKTAAVDPDMITECRDGSVVYGNASCKP